MTNRLSNLLLDRGCPSWEPEDEWEEKEGCLGLVHGERQGALFNVDWSQSVVNALDSWVELVEPTYTLEALAKEVLLLKERLIRLEEEQAVRVPIQSLSPEPYELLRPFEVVVRKCDDQFLATFYDANLSASGDTDIEAVSNLKDIIIGTLEVLLEHDESHLGPGPRQQLEVLASFIKRSG